MKSAKSVVKTEKRRTNEAKLELQSCFVCTDQSVFETTATDVDELTATLYISVFLSMCAQTKLLHITIFE